MLRSQLEHILRASGAIVDERVMIVVGSQAILGTLADPPSELVVSREADLYPRDAPQKSDLITSSLGEYSLFDETFGYHADGVSPTTAVVPGSWTNRLVPFQTDSTGGVLALCLSPVDIAISKLVAGRKKDLDYVAALFRHRIVTPEEVKELLWELSTEPRTLVETRLAEMDQTGT